MKVQDVMRTDFSVVSPHDPIRLVASILARDRGSTVLVVDDAGEVVGVVSEDVLARILDRISDAHDAGEARPLARVG